MGNKQNSGNEVHLSLQKYHELRENGRLKV